MITNPDWHKPKGNPYFHKISLDCIEKLVECMENIDIEVLDCNTCLIMQEILSDEIDDADFAIDNLEELSSYIINGNLNIRIHRDITGPPTCPYLTVRSGGKTRRVNLPDEPCGG